MSSPLQANRTKLSTSIDKTLWLSLTPCHVHSKSLHAPIMWLSGQQTALHWVRSPRQGIATMLQWFHHKMWMTLLHPVCYYYTSVCEWPSSPTLPAVGEGHWDSSVSGKGKRKRRRGERRRKRKREVPCCLLQRHQTKRKRSQGWCTCWLLVGFFFGFGCA